MPQQYLSTPKRSPIRRAIQEDLGPGGTRLPAVIPVQRQEEPAEALEDERPVQGKFILQRSALQEQEKPPLPPTWNMTQRQPLKGTAIADAPVQFTLKDAQRWIKKNLETKDYKWTEEEILQYIEDKKDGWKSLKRRLKKEKKEKRRKRKKRNSHSSEDSVEKTKKRKKHKKEKVQEPEKQEIVEKEVSSEEYGPVPPPKVYGPTPPPKAPPKKLGTPAPHSDWHFTAEETRVKLMNAIYPPRGSQIDINQIADGLRYGTIRIGKGLHQDDHITINSGPGYHVYIQNPRAATWTITSITKGIH